MAAALHEQLLAKQMDRKQFLQYSGATLLTVFGLHNLISVLTGKKPRTLSDLDAKHGFGSSKFGV